MTEENVYLFIPNIIGYVRVILVFLSLYAMFTYPWLAALAYFMSVVLDELDGMAARALNQCTKFGAILDVITDRCGSAAFMAGLGHLYPSYILVFQSLIVLEISSLWTHMYSSLHRGTSVKVDDPSAHPLMRFYYTPHVLSMFCLGNGTFIVSIYLQYFMPGLFPVTVLGYEVGLCKLVAVAFFPIAFMKQSMYVLQLLLAFQSLALFDATNRVQKTS